MPMLCKMLGMLLVSQYICSLDFRVLLIILLEEVVRLKWQQTIIVLKKVPVVQSLQVIVVEGMEGGLKFSVSAQ